MDGRQIPRKPKRSASTVSRVLPDGRIIELVYRLAERKTLLAVYRGEQVSYETVVELDGGETLVPVSPDHNLIKHGVLVLPEAAEPFESPAQLVAEIQAYLHRYVDLSDGFTQIASYYALLTWVYDAFNELPYLRLRGEYGTGKTRALLVLGSICYKGFFASGASTVSPIFHTLDQFRGALIFDETDFRFSDEKAEIIKIFNNGNVKGFPVLRAQLNLKHEFEPRAFAVFGPKIVAMRRSFDDQALESRFLTEEMGQRSLRRDIPINLPDAQKEEAKSLRNRLLMYRFQYLGKTAINDTLTDPTLSPRMNQVLLPLLSIIDRKDLQEEIGTVARNLEETLAVERSVTTEAQLLGVIASLAGGTASIPVAEITRAFIERHGMDYERPITNRYLGSLLRKHLRLKTYKTNGVYVLSLKEDEKLKTLCARYGVSWVSLDNSPVSLPDAESAG
jgi:hypothetical protein